MGHQTEQACGMIWAELIRRQEAERAAVASTLNSLTDLNRRSEQILADLDRGLNGTPPAAPLPEQRRTFDGLSHDDLNLVGDTIRAKDFLDTLK